jgi:hypothetical protein
VRRASARTRTYKNATDFPSNDIQEFESGKRKLTAARDAREMTAEVAAAAVGAASSMAAPSGVQDRATGASHAGSAETNMDSFSGNRVEEGKQKDGKRE